MYTLKQTPPAASKLSGTIKEHGLSVYSLQVWKKASRTWSFNWSCAISIEPRRASNAKVCSAPLYNLRRASIRARPSLLGRGKAVVSVGQSLRRDVRVSEAAALPRRVPFIPSPKTWVDRSQFQVVSGGRHLPFNTDMNPLCEIRKLPTFGGGQKMLPIPPPSLFGQRQVLQNFICCPDRTASSPPDPVRAFSLGPYK